MASTIIGLFEGPTQAEQARSEVMALQIPNTEIQVYDEAGFNLTGGTDTSTKGFWESLSQTLLFGPSNQAMQQYQEGVRRGGTVVSVRADENRTDEIADILNQCGSVDIDERAAEWQLGGWKIKDPLPEAGQSTTTTRAKEAGKMKSQGVKRGCVWVYSVVSIDQNVA